MASWPHLAWRFVSSFDPRAPSADDRVWVTTVLNADEQALWRQMSRADQRHACGVAHRVAGALGDTATDTVLAAALLHDVGKLDSGLGTFGRVVATLSGKVAGTSMAVHWSSASGFTRRVGLYLRHAEIGADRLALAGSDALVVSWAREHHQPSEQWSLAMPIARALKEADGD